MMYSRLMKVDAMLNMKVPNLMMTQVILHVCSLPCVSGSPRLGQSGRVAASLCLGVRTALFLAAGSRSARPC